MALSTPLSVRSIVGKAAISPYSFIQHGNKTKRVSNIITIDNIRYRIWKTLSISPKRTLYSIALLPASTLIPKNRYSFFFEGFLQVPQDPFP